MLFIPVDAIRYDLWVDVAGFALAVVLIAREYLVGRTQRQTA